MTIDVSETTYDVTITPPYAVTVNANVGEPKIIVLYGTADPPSAVGLADGTLYFKYV